MTPSDDDEPLEKALQKARALLEGVPPRHREAFQMMSALIGALEPVAAQQAESEIRRVIDAFHKKNQRDLSDLLDETIAALGARLSTAPPELDDVPALREQLRARLTELSERHIFQWTTYYREAVGSTMADAVRLASRLASPSPVAVALGEEFASHALEVFSKGFQRQVREGRTHTDAVAKSANGVRRFLELPLQFYVQSAIRFDLQAPEARAVRAVTSAVISGIVRGYGSVVFGDHTGFQLLELSFADWLQYTVFLTVEDARKLASSLSNGAARALMSALAVPLVDAIDRSLSQRSGQDFSLPTTALYSREGGLLAVTMSLPRQDRRDYLQLRCYSPLSDRPVSGAVLDECVRAEIDIVVAPVEHGVREAWYAKASPDLLTLLVPYDIGTVQQEESINNLTDRLVDALSQQFAASLGGDWLNEPLVYNYAADFPLNNPQLLKYYLVQRRSVSNLLAMFETGTGIHLWCSVRRSGKTTACSELGATSRGALVAFQTMQLRPDQPDLNAFERGVRDALQNGRRLPDSFVQDTVRECAGASLNLRGTTKTVFVLDEYELLFGLLKASGRADEALRYQVIFPLLNQLVSYARDNLLILVGQQPDAHYVFLEHNQLSPLVSQSLFPLFEHKTGEPLTEFTEFLRRVLTSRVDFETSFADAVFEETSGHPYLTVNLMTDLFDWMIAHKRRGKDLSLSSTDFRNFAGQRFAPDVLRVSARYDFFRQMLGRSMGSDARAHQPWLFAVTSCVRDIAQRAPNSLQATLPEFKELAGKYAEACGLVADELLVTAERSNFLRYRGGYVTPAIKIMGRIANVSRPLID